MSCVVTEKLNKEGVIVGRVRYTAKQYVDNWMVKQVGG